MSILINQSSDSFENQYGHVDIWIFLYTNYCGGIGYIAQFNLNTFWNCLKIFTVTFNGSH